MARFSEKVGPSDHLQMSPRAEGLLRNDGGRFEIDSKPLKRFYSIQGLVELREIEPYNATLAFKIIIPEGPAGGIFDL